MVPLLPKLPTMDLEYLDASIQGATDEPHDHEQALDAARAMLDTLGPADAVTAIAELLDWSSMPEGSSPRRERCRLVSYAAIMHGSDLLPHMPHVVALLANLLGHPDGAVSEELLRAIGNCARYVLNTAPGAAAPPPQTMSTLLAPLLGGAASGAGGRAGACLLGVHRILLELPPELQRPPPMLACLRELHGALTARAQRYPSPDGRGPPPVEAFAPLSRVAQLLGSLLPEAEMHVVAQYAIDGLQAGLQPDGSLRPLEADTPASGPSTASTATTGASSGAAELRASFLAAALGVLRTLAQPLRSHTTEATRTLTQWIVDELMLLPQQEAQTVCRRRLPSPHPPDSHTPPSQTHTHTHNLAAPRSP